MYKEVLHVRRGASSKSTLLLHATRTKRCKRRGHTYKEEVLHVQRGASGRSALLLYVQRGASVGATRAKRCYMCREVQAVE